MAADFPVFMTREEAIVAKAKQGGLCGQLILGGFVSITICSELFLIS
jgi:hypothetical protein